MRPVYLMSLFVLLFVRHALCGDIPSWITPDMTLDRHFTNNEVLRMPAYCQVRLPAQHLDVIENRPVEGQLARLMDEWGQVMQGGWGSFHHYCWAIGWMNRYDDIAGNPQIKPEWADRVGSNAYNFLKARPWILINRAIGELGYVKANLDPRRGPFPLLPELYFTRGTLKMELFDISKSNKYNVHRVDEGFPSPDVLIKEAIEEFVQAISVKRDYTDAYAELSNALLKAGDTGQAREILLLGIKYSDNPEFLRSRLALLR